MKEITISQDDFREVVKDTIEWFADITMKNKDDLPMALILKYGVIASMVLGHLEDKLFDTEPEKDTEEED